MPTEATTATLSLADEAATRALGAALAAACKPGSVILLRGPLGAGKTTLADGFAQALGAGHATSPTFVIAHYYGSGRIPIWHVDLHRIASDDEIIGLDLAQYVSDRSITLCEWPERSYGSWPADSLTVDIAIDGQRRRAVVTASGSNSREIIAALEAPRPAEPR